MVSSVNNSLYNKVSNSNNQSAKTSAKSSCIDTLNQGQDELLISEDAAKTIEIDSSINKPEIGSATSKTHSFSNKKIGYYNYYKIPHRYSPTEVVDRYQEMEERYNGDKLYANNENPYSEENIHKSIKLLKIKSPEKSFLLYKF